MALDIGIKLNLEGYDGVMADLQRLDNYAKTHSKTEIKMNLENARREVMAYRGEINRLKGEMESAKTTISSNKSTAQDLAKAYKSGKMSAEDFAKNIKTVANNIRNANKVLSENGSKITETQGKWKQASMAVQEYSAAMREANRHMTMGQVYRRVSSGLGHIGAAAQSLGNALVRIGSPFERLTSGFIMGAGYKLLGQVTEGVNSAFTRADTMRKYTRLMEEYSTKTYTANDSIKQLDESVQGLPIALDDAVSLAQRYTLSLGDMERGTSLAIATNNAFLASMATETQRYQGMMQMQDLLNGKKLNSREWMSLGASMGKAINEIGRELGYGKDQMGEFRQQLYAGEISTKDFLDALEKVGTGEGSLVKLAQESMDTWEAFFSRIRTAFSRFGYGVITEMDELVSTVTNGKFTSLNSFLDDKLIPSIDKMTGSVKDWIKAHPDEIVNFFKQFQDIDFASIIKGVGEGMLTIAQFYGSFARVIGKIPKIGWFITIAGPLGRMLLMAGGLIKGLRIPLGLLSAGLFGGVTRLLRNRTIMGAGGIFGAIGRLFGGGKGVGGMAANLPAPSAMNTMRNVFNSLSGVLVAAGSIAIPAATIWGTVKALKSVITDFRDISSIIGDVDWDVSAKAFGAFAGFIGAFALVGNALGSNISAGINTLFGEAALGAITTFASGIAALDMKLIKSAFKSFSDITGYLTTGIDNLNNLKGFKKGTATRRIKALLDTMAEVYSSLKVTDSEGKSLMAASQQEISAMKTIVGGMAGIIEIMPGISETMKTLQGSDLISGKDAKAVGEKISGMLEGLGEAFTSFLGQDYGKNPDELTMQMKNTITNFSDALNAITGKDGMLASMRRVLNETRDIPGVESVSSTISRLKALLSGEDGKGGLFKELADITKLQGDISATDTFKTKMENLAEGFKSIKKVFKKLKEIEGTGLATQGKDATGNFTAVTMLQGLINQLSGVLGSSTYTGLQSDMTAFTTAINELMTAIGELSTQQEIDVKFELKGGAVQGYKTVVKKINDAIDAIKKAESKIPKRIYHSIPVTISANVDTSGAVSAISTGADYVRRVLNNAMPKQLGGTVYRARGGSIFKPRGTDIVPAMLTPGEFVHNKKAVDYFGVDFMKRINALDVKGAVQALMNRGGMAATNLNRQSVINNTVNNNQRVTQNINTNNPNMAKMSIGRYAGAF